MGFSLDQNMACTGSCHDVISLQVIDMTTPQSCSTDKHAHTEAFPLCLLLAVNSTPTPIRRATQYRCCLRQRPQTFQPPALKLLYTQSMFSLAARSREAVFSYRYSALLALFACLALGLTNANLAPSSLGLVAVAEESPQPLSLNQQLSGDDDQDGLPPPPLPPLASNPRLSLPYHGPTALTQHRWQSHSPRAPPLTCAA